MKLCLIHSGYGSANNSRIWFSEMTQMSNFMVFRELSEEASSKIKTWYNTCGQKRSWGINQTRASSSCKTTEQRAGWGYLFVTITIKGINSIKTINFSSLSKPSCKMICFHQLTWHWVLLKPLGSVQQWLSVKTLTTEGNVRVRLSLSYDCFYFSATTVLDLHSKVILNALFIINLFSSALILLYSYWYIYIYLCKLVLSKP